MSDHHKRTVVITGAGSGIGKETALAFGALGYSLHLTDINQVALQEVKSLLAKTGCAVHLYNYDVTNSEQMNLFAKEFGQNELYLDILCNNAGIGVGSSFEELDLDGWQRVMNINFWGVIYGIRAFLPYLKKNLRGAHIINVASMSGLVGMPGMSAYTCSKFAVVGLSESLASELAPFGIKVTAICPGIINTNIIKNSHLVSYGSLTDEVVAKLYQRFGAHPRSVAKDIVKAAKSNRVIKLSRPGPMRFLYWIKIFCHRFFIWSIKWGSARLTKDRING